MLVSIVAVIVVPDVAALATDYQQGNWQGVLDDKNNLGQVMALAGIVFWVQVLEAARCSDVGSAR